VKNTYFEAEVCYVYVNIIYVGNVIAVYILSRWGCVRENESYIVMTHSLLSMKMIY
jgi:hypothetical protein